MHVALQMRVGVHVCTCVNLYVRVGTYMHHVSVVVCMCLCVQKCTDMHVCVLKHVRVCKYVCKYVLVCVEISKCATCEYMYVLVCLRE
jgi:hypothetical protein